MQWLISIRHHSVGICNDDGCITARGHGGTTTTPHVPSPRHHNTIKSSTGWCFPEMIVTCITSCLQHDARSRSCRGCTSKRRQVADKAIENDSLSPNENSKRTFADKTKVSNKITKPNKTKQNLTKPKGVERLSIASVSFRGGLGGLGLPQSCLRQSCPIWRPVN